MSAMPRVVILGGGYGGISTAKKLQKEVHFNEAYITLLNCHDYHYFTTHSHMYGNGTDSIEHTRVAISELVDEFKIDLVTSNIREIRLFDKKVVLQDGIISYDYLVVAVGGEPEYFGIPGLKEYAMTIRNTNSVRVIHQHIEYQFTLYKVDETRTERLSFVIGGAGCRGVEIVAELADRIPQLCRKYGVDPSLVHVYNVEAAPTALPNFDSEMVDYAMDALQKKGVEFKTGLAIKECKPDGVHLTTGERIKAATVVWAGGVRGNRLIEAAGFETVRGRVKVDEYLHAQGYENVFVIGDSSLIFDAEGHPYPPTAQMAIQQGIICAQNIVASIRGKELKNFIFSNKGTVVSLGKGEGIALTPGKRYKGWRAVLLKKLIAIRYLFTIGGITLALRKGRFL